MGFYKVDSGKKSITWSEAVDQALCFGWIDGVRRSIDDISYCNRFTPRRPNSNWSDVNIKKVEALIRQGLMHAAGITAFEKRKENRSRVYSFEKLTGSLSPGLEKKFRADKKAWAFFEALAPSYRRTSIHWVMDAKQQETREKRLNSLIKDSAAGTNQWKDNKYTKPKKTANKGTGRKK